MNLRVVNGLSDAFFTWICMYFMENFAPVSIKELADSLVLLLRQSGFEICNPDFMKSVALLLPFPVCEVVRGASSSFCTHLVEFSREHVGLDVYVF